MIVDAPSLTPTEFNENKKDFAVSLRKTNASTIDSAPWTFWDVEGVLKTTTIDSSDVAQQLSIAENGVNYSIRQVWVFMTFPANYLQMTQLQFNDLKVWSSKLTHELKQALDTLEQEKKTYENLMALQKAQTGEGMRIEQVATVRIL